MPAIFYSRKEIRLIFKSHSVWSGVSTFSNILHFNVVFFNISSQIYSVFKVIQCLYILGGYLHTVLWCYKGIFCTNSFLSAFAVQRHRQCKRFQLLNLSKATSTCSLFHCDSTLTDVKLGRARLLSLTVLVIGFSLMWVAINKPHPRVCWSTTSCKTTTIRHPGDATQQRSLIFRLYKI